MISKELEETFNRAVEVARSRRHDMVGLEHLLLAMLDDPFALEILRACGAQVQALADGLKAKARIEFKEGAAKR